MRLKRNDDLLEEAARAAIAQRERIRDLSPDEREHALTQFCQDVLGLTLASMVPMQSVLASTAVGSPDDGYHILLYAHIRDQPEAVLGGLVGALKPFLVGNYREGTMMSIDSDGELTPVAKVP